MGFLVKNIENFNEYKNIQYTNQADAMSLSIIGMIGRSDIALYQTVKNTVLVPFHLILLGTFLLLWLHRLLVI